MQITVTAGQNLTRIARAQNTSVAAIVQANSLSNRDRIYIGQKLTMPGGDEASDVPVPGASSKPITGAAADPAATSLFETAAPAAKAPAASSDVHVVVRLGQTLSNIAQRFHTSVAALVSANHLSNPDEIVIGQKLTVPNGKDRPIAIICPKPEGIMPALPPEANTQSPRPVTPAAPRTTQAPARPTTQAPARPTSHTPARPTAPARETAPTNRANLSEADVTALMRAVAAEARGEDHSTQMGVAQTIINYSRQSGIPIGRLTRSTYLSSNQDGNSHFYHMAPDALPNSRSIRAAVLSAADFRSPVGKLTHFHDTSINTPSWGNRRTRVQLGHVVFYDAK